MAIESVESRESLDVNAGGVMRLIRRRWLPAAGVFVLTVAAAALVASLQEETYVASAKLLFRIDRTSTLTGVGEGVSELDPLVRTQNPLVTEVEVISSRPLLEQTVSELELETGSDPALSASDIRRGLAVEIIGGADVLQVSYESDNPEQAAEVVNKLAEVYIENNIVANRAKASQARELIESQLPQAETFVQESEEALRDFKERNQVVAIDQETQSVSGTLQDLNSQILDTQAALEEATARSTQLRNNLGLDLQEALLVSDLSQSPAIQGVLEQLQQVERDLAVQQGFYTDESPIVRDYQGQINELSNLLRQEISTVMGGQAQVPEGFLQTGQTRQALITDFLSSEVQRLSLLSRLNTLYNSQSAYQTRSNVLPRLEQQESELQRKLEVATLNYQTLLQRLQELKVAENQAGGSARIIEPAMVPNSPQSGQSTIILLAGVLLGTLLAATLVFVLEIMDYSEQARSQQLSRRGLEPVEH